MAGRTELDRWARALKAENDADALVALAKLRERLVNLAVLGLRLQQMLEDAPEPELLASLRNAKNDGVNLWSAICTVEERFKAHERGDR